MEYVVFSMFIPLRTIVNTIRILNKQHYIFSNSYFKYFKNYKKDSLKFHYYYYAYEYTTCNNCKQLRRCKSYVFNFLDGKVCYSCQPEIIAHSNAKKILDLNVLVKLDKLYKNKSIYYLVEDIKAYNFLYTGPTDRRIVRDKKYALQKQIRFDKIVTILKTTDERYRKELMNCIYITNYINGNFYGIRAIKKIIKTCSSKAIEVYNCLKHYNDSKITPDKCLSWGAEVLFKRRFRVNVEKISEEKEMFIELQKQIQIVKMEQENRKDKLIRAFQVHGFLYNNLMNMFPYIRHGIPSLEETCKDMFFIKWLHESTPFSMFVEENKINRGYNLEWIKPDPYYNMIYTVCVEAKEKVLNIGYKCPDFSYINIEHEY